MKQVTAVQEVRSDEKQAWWMAVWKNAKKVQEI